MLGLTPQVRAKVKLDREVVTTEAIAAALEHRVYGPDVDQDQVRQGCEYALEVGVAAVVCRPDQLAIVAGQLAGTPTATVTALAFNDRSRQHDPADLAAEAQELVWAGAAEVALIVAPGLDGAGCLHLVREQLTAVVEAAQPQGGKVRVLLDTTLASKDQMKACTALVGAGGPTLVQGGTYSGDRASFSQIEAMRHALPAEVLLKWTQPLRSVEMMLVCLSLGVDRFNGDIPTLLKSAERSSQLAPLMLPIHGVDF